MFNLFSFIIFMMIVALMVAIYSFVSSNIKYSSESRKILNESIQQISYDKILSTGSDVSKSVLSKIHILLFSEAASADTICEKFYFSNDQVETIRSFIKIPARYVKTCIKEGKDLKIHFDIQRPILNIKCDVINPLNGITRISPNVKEYNDIIPHEVLLKLSKADIKDFTFAIEVTRSSNVNERNKNKPICVYNITYGTNVESIEVIDEDILSRAMIILTNGKAFFYR